MSLVPSSSLGGGYQFVGSNSARGSSTHARNSRLKWEETYTIPANAGDGQHLSPALCSAKWGQSGKIVLSDASSDPVEVAGFDWTVSLFPNLLTDHFGLMVAPRSPSPDQETLPSGYSLIYTVNAVIKHQSGDDSKNVERSWKCNWWPGQKIKFGVKISTGSSESKKSNAPKAAQPLIARKELQDPANGFCYKKEPHRSSLEKHGYEAFDLNVTISVSYCYAEMAAPRANGVIPAVMFWQEQQIWQSHEAQRLVGLDVEKVKRECEQQIQEAIKDKEKALLKVESLKTKNAVQAADCEKRISTAWAKASELIPGVLQRIQDNGWKELDRLGDRLLKRIDTMGNEFRTLANNMESALQNNLDKRQEFAPATPAPPAAVGQAQGAASANNVSRDVLTEEINKGILPMGDQVKNLSTSMTLLSSQVQLLQNAVVNNAATAATMMQYQPSAGQVPCMPVSARPSAYGLGGNGAGYPGAHAGMPPLLAMQPQHPDHLQPQPLLNRGGIGRNPMMPNTTAAPSQKLNWSGWNQSGPEEQPVLVQSDQNDQSFGMGLDQGPMEVHPDRLQQLQERTTLGPGRTSDVEFRLTTPDPNNNKPQAQQDSKQNPPTKLSFATGPSETTGGTVNGVSNQKNPFTFGSLPDTLFGSKGGDTAAPSIPSFSIPSSGFTQAVSSRSGSQLGLGSKPLEPAKTSFLGKGSLQSVDEKQPETSNKDVDPEDGKFKIIDLAPVELDTGEKDEICIFKEYCKLYRFKDEEWKGRGTGYLKLLQTKQEGNRSMRLVLRQKETGKLYLNCTVIPEKLHVKPEHPQRVFWGGVDTANDEGEPVNMTYMCRFKEDKHATDLEDLAKGKVQGVAVDTASKGATPVGKKVEPSEPVAAISPPIQEQKKAEPSMSTSTTTPFGTSTNIFGGATTEPVFGSSTEPVFGGSTTFTGFGSSAFGTSNNAFSLKPKESSPNKGVFGNLGKPNGEPEKVSNIFALPSGTSSTGLFGGATPITGIGSSPAKLNQGGTVKIAAEENPNEDWTKFKMVDLKKVETDTGESMDDLVFEGYCKLYRFSDEQWKGRGNGNLKLLKAKDPNDPFQLRLVLRQKETKKLYLNCTILPAMVNWKEEQPRRLFWAGADTANDEKSQSNQAFHANFKDPDDAKKLYNIIHGKTKAVPIQSKGTSGTPVKKKEGAVGGSGVAKAPKEEDEKKPEAAPPSEPEAASKPFSFASFAATPAAPDTGSDPAKPFSFSSGFGGFAAGLGSADTGLGAASSGNIFGSSSNTSNTGLFGTVNPLTGPAKVETKPVTASPFKAPAKVVPGAIPAEENPNEDWTKFKMVDLKEVKIETGEENEICVFNKMCRLYRLTDGEWKGRGNGPLRLLKNPKPKPGASGLRLVLRQKETGKLYMNCSIHPEHVTYKEKSQPARLFWAGKDTANEEQTVMTQSFHCIFKEADHAKNLSELISGKVEATEIDEKGPDAASKPKPAKSPAKSPATTAEAVASPPKTAPPSEPQSMFTGFGGGSGENAFDVTKYSFGGGIEKNDDGGNLFGSTSGGFLGGLGSGGTDWGSGDKNDGGSMFEPVNPMGNAGTKKAEGGTEKPKPSANFGSEENPNEDWTKFKMVDLKEVKTDSGESEETLLFSKFCFLYRFADGEWKGRGTGDIKLLKAQKSKAGSSNLRLVLRQKETGKLYLNCKIEKDQVNYKKEQPNRLFWAGIDTANDEHEPTNQVCHCKFKEANDAEKLNTLIKENDTVMIFV